MNLRRKLAISSINTHQEIAYDFEYVTRGSFQSSKKIGKYGESQTTWNHIKIISLKVSM